MIARVAMIASLVMGAFGCAAPWGENTSRPADPDDAEGAATESEGDPPHPVEKPTTELAPVAAEAGADPDRSVAGSFTGQWLSRTSRGGELRVELTGEEGSLLSGSVAFEGSPCFAGGTFSGSASEDGTVRGQVRAGSSEIAVTFTVGDDWVSGTYEVLEGGACKGDTGTLSARP